MSHKHLLVILALLICALFVDFSHSQPIPNSDLCLPRERDVLLRIKKFLRNPSSLSSWDPKTDCASWNGIRCNIDGHVTMVQFEETETNDIRGTIPPFLDQLPALFLLSFTNIPNLSGPIPSYIGKLTNLTDLYIVGTNVGGPLPQLLGQLTNLDRLELSSNKFSGPIPNYLGQLKKLTSLGLSSNLLTGSISVGLAQLTKLKFLELSSNKLSGPIPDFIGPKLKSLIILRLDFNSLSGPIPTNMGSLPELQTLALDGNQLTGPIPKSMARGNILTISLSQNKLSGDAAFLLEKPNNDLFSLQISHNLLKFDFSHVNFSSNIYEFNISHNMIYGSIPLRFGVLKLHSFDVSYNQLCGPIPNGRRFKQVPALFAHNKCLCGGPFPGCKQLHAFRKWSF